MEAQATTRTVYSPNPIKPEVRKDVFHCLCRYQDLLREQYAEARRANDADECRRINDALIDSAVDITAMLFRNAYARRHGV